MAQEAAFWDRETLVGTVEKNATERIAVRRVERRGRAYVDVRIEWRRQDTEEFLPSRRGVVIPEEAVDDVMVLMEAARDSSSPGRGAGGGRRASADQVRQKSSPKAGRTTGQKTGQGARRRRAGEGAEKGAEEPDADAEGGSAL